MSAIETARQLVAESLECPLETVPADGTMDSVPGWDSLGHVRILLALEARLGRSLTSAEIASVEGLPAIATLLANGSNS